MKKVVLTALMSVLMAGAFQAVADDEYNGPTPTPTPETPITVDGGKILFKGSIVAAPCAVDNDTDGEEVRLGQVPVNHFTAKGSTSAAVPFTIKLTGCVLDKNAIDPATTATYTSAAITFHGETVTGTPTALSIEAAASGAGDSTDTAKNVGIQILQNGKAIAVDGSAATAKQKIYAGSNELPFSADYVATADKVTAGSANSSVNFQVTYS